MAQTTLIPDTLLLVGQEVHLVLPQVVEAATIEAVALQVGTAQSVIRVAIIDATNHVLDGTILNGTDDQEILVTKIPSAITISLTCLSGSARVQLLGLSGADAFGGIQTQTADIADLAVTTNKLADAALAASAAGRLKMATGFFNAAKLLDAILANAFDAAACANAFAAGAIPVAKVASAPLSLESIIADPGNGLGILVTGSGTCILTVGAGAETRTVADPAVAGRVIQIQTTVFGIGSLAVVFASDVTLTPGENSVAFTAAGQSFTVVSVAVGAGFKWRVLSNPQALVIS